MTTDRSDEALDAILREGRDDPTECRNVAGPDFDAIAARHEGTLSDEDARDVEAHLQICRLCREIDAQFVALTASDPVAGVDEALLDRVDAALAASRPDLDAPEAAAPPRPRGPSMWQRVLLGLAAVVPVALAFVFIPSTAPAYRITVASRGRGLAEHRSSEAPPSSRFGPDSLLAYDVTVALDAGQPEPVLRVYVEGPDGRLVRASPSIRTEVGERALSYAVDARAEELLGDVAGARTIWFGAGASAESFEGLDGATVEAARRRDVSWAEAKVFYATQARAPFEPRLHGSLAIQQLGSKRTYFFDDAHLPRVQLDGRATWTIATEDDTGRSVLVEATPRSNAPRTHLSRLEGEAPRIGELVARADDGREQRWAYVWKGADHPAYRDALRPLLESVARGRAAYRSGDRKAAAHAWREAIRRAEASGFYSEAASRQQALAFVANGDDRFDEALALIEAARADARRVGSDELLALCDYYEGLVHLDRRGPRSFVEAQRLLKSAVDFAEAVGDEKTRRLVVQPLVMLWATSGRAAEAVRLLRRTPPGDDDEPLYEGHYYANLADALHRARRSRQMDVDVDEILRLVRLGLERYEESKTRQFAANARALIARVALDDDRREEARTEITALLRMTDEDRTEVRWEVELLEAELLLGDGDLDAARTRAISIEARMRKERGGNDSHVACAARALLGRIEEAAGDDALALAHDLEATERLGALRRVLVNAPAQAALLADHADLHRATVGLLLGADRVAEAARRVDERRAHVLVELAGDAARIEPVDLDASRERLGPRRAFLIAAATRDTEVSFWVSSKGVEVAAGDDPIAPWADRIDALEHLYVSPGTSARAFDLRAREGGPTVSLVPHSGLVARAIASPGSGVLIVADPNRDLLEAAAEGRRLADRFADSSLLIHEDATRTAVITAMRASRALHVGAHGAVGANDPWSARILLSDGDLTIEDIFEARPEGLRVAVLVGCTTGGAQREVSDGLPQALLTAGARTVIATVEEIGDDPELRAFVDAFYREGGDRSPGRAFAKAANSSSVGRLFRLWGEP